MGAFQFQIKNSLPESIAISTHSPQIKVEFCAQAKAFLFWAVCSDHLLVMLHMLCLPVSLLLLVYQLQITDLDGTHRHAGRCTLLHCLQQAHALLITHTLTHTHAHTHTHTTGAGNLIDIHVRICALYVDVAVILQGQATLKSNFEACWTNHLTSLHT